MGPTTFALCQKAVFGPAMWIAGLCAFPPLIRDVPLPLDAAGATVSVPFTAPVDKRYQLVLGFDFPSVQARLQDVVVGDRYHAACVSSPESLVGRPGFGRAVPIRVVIRRAEGGDVVVDQTFTSMCVFGHSEHRKWRSVGWVQLPRGPYTAEITNVDAQPGLEGVKTVVSLVPGGRK